MNTESNHHASEDLLNTSEVAALLRCSSRTISRMIESGTLPKPIKIGKLNRWRRDAIERWIANGCPANNQNRGQS